MIIHPNLPEGMIVLEPALNRLNRPDEVWFDALGSSALWVAIVSDDTVQFSGYCSGNNISVVDIQSPKEIIDWMTARNFVTEEAILEYYKGKR